MALTQAVLLALWTLPTQTPAESLQPIPLSPGEVATAPHGVGCSEMPAEYCPTHSCPHCAKRGRCFWDWWYSSCDMVQHYPYYPVLHGNYYFRPYGPRFVTRQQADVARWGGDPRNPYDNAVFQRVYDDLEQETGSPFSEEAGDMEPPQEKPVEAPTPPVEEKPAEAPAPPPTKFNP